MRILHFADLHIGHENYGKPDPKTGLSTRLLDFLEAFDQIVEYALKNKIDYVIFAGDAYKTRDPSPTYQREFSKRIKKIAEKIPVLMVTGNHDIPPSFGKADTLEIFPTLDIKNVYVSSKPQIVEINGLQIVALPWILRSHLLEEKERRKPIEEIRNILSNKICQIFKDLLKKIDPKKPAIAIIHQSVSGAVFAHDQETYIGNDPLIPVSLLANKKLSYVALGHLHKFQVLSKNPPVIYSGSPERIDFGEAKEKKGFVIADINPQNKSKTKFKFISLNARKFITINIEIPVSEENPNEYVMKEIKKRKIKNSILKITISGQDSQLARILESDLKKATSDAHFVVAISKKSEKKETRIEITKEHLRPIDWVGEYLKHKKYSLIETKILQEAAEKLMEEVGM